MDFPKVVPFDRKSRYGTKPVTRRDTKMAVELVTIALRAGTIYRPETRTNKLK